MCLASTDALNHLAGATACFALGAVLGATAVTNRAQVFAAPGRAGFGLVPGIKRGFLRHHVLLACLSGVRHSLGEAMYGKKLVVKDGQTHGSGTAKKTVPF
jgi:hypothetical protein